MNVKLPISQKILPLGSVDASGGILELNANNTIKYTAHITLSAATPAAITDGERLSASEIAM